MTTTTNIAESALDFVLPFGKYKGQNFQSTPKGYQEWLLAQDWFTVPAQKPIKPDYDRITSIQKEMASVSKSLNGWNGHSRQGQAAYDRMFELEMAESDAMYCNCGNLNEPGKSDCGMDCGF
jgi:hypothetical protein